MNPVSWFEVPVEDMQRAKSFYEKVFDLDVQVQDFGGVMMGFFPSDENGMGASGSLLKNPSYVPAGSEGVLIYFNCGDLGLELGRVEAAGGNVLKEKTQISPEVGYMGLFMDTEGNRIALHSRV